MDFPFGGRERDSDYIALVLPQCHTPFRTDYDINIQSLSHWLLLMSRNLYEVFWSALISNFFKKARNYFRKREYRNAT